jgi:hypothetical protein
MILQKFSYPLGATCFTEKECNSIQAKYMPMVLSKMGINRSTPTEVQSGPALYAGMSVSKLWPLQGSTKNKLLIGHLRKSDNVGTNLQVELDCLQLQAGVLWDVLSREGTMIRKYVDKKCWTSHLWEFNDRYGLTVKREDKAWLLPQREHDQFIMEALTNLPAATSKRLRGAQCCQLFLQVTTLADITNSAGTKLSKWVTNPRYSQPSQRHATFIYPNQAKPNSTVWNDFVKLLQLAFTDGTNNKLRQPLGNWYRGRISQAWNQVFSPADHKIYSLETEPHHTF